jgi:hypothetical protein
MAQLSGFSFYDDDVSSFRPKYLNIFWPLLVQYLSPPRQHPSYSDPLVHLCWPKPHLGGSIIVRWGRRVYKAF